MEIRNKLLENMNTHIKDNIIDFFNLVLGKGEETDYFYLKILND